MSIRWTRAADQDLDEIKTYIAQARPGAEMRVADELLVSVTRLATYPTLGRAGRVPGTREWVLSELPFILVYRVLDEDLQILRVLHTARRWP